MNYSYGAEIEFIDVDRREINLPAGCSFSNKEITLVNSDGTAVNTKKRSKYFIGGEVNTPPTGYSTQLNLIKNTCEELVGKGAKYNYRCNAQVWIGVGELSVKNINDIFRYSMLCFDNAMKVTNQLTDKPDAVPHSLWASVFRQRIVPEWRMVEFEKCKTHDELLKTMFLGKKGEFSPMTFTRYWVNPHGYWKHRAVEFRPWWPSFDWNDFANMFEFSQMFLKYALAGAPYKDPKWILDLFSGIFPEMPPFLPEVEKGFQKTKIKK